MRQIRQRLTYANVVSTLALILVVGGATALAAKIPKHSVGPHQLRSNAVTTRKIKKNAVTAVKIKDGAIKESLIRSVRLTLDSPASACNRRPSCSRSAST